MSGMRRWCFTIHLEEGQESTEPGSFISILRCRLDAKCSRWVFQLEKGEESGRLHLQGRCSFKAPKRNPSECNKAIAVGHWSVESDTAGGDFYCTKDETRVAGPWSDKDKKKKLPWDLQRIDNWKPWQLSIMESMKEKDDRIINVLIDEVGGIGKSKVFKHCLFHGLAGLIPVIGDAKDIIQAVCSMGEREAYIIDLPRTAESAVHQASIFKAIEQIKNGIVIDLRYKYTELIMGSPVVWIFTNQMPEAMYLSKDRWRYWCVKDDTLIEWRIV